MFAYRNYWQWEEKEEIFNRTVLSQQEYEFVRKASANWHKWQAGLQLLVGIGIVAFMLVGGHSIIQSLLSGLVFGSIFWVVFDTITAYKLTGNALYLGNTAWLDKNLKKIFGEKLAFVGKVLLLCIVINLLIFSILKDW